MVVAWLQLGALGEGQQRVQALFPQLPLLLNLRVSGFVPLPPRRPVAVGDQHLGERLVALQLRIVLIPVRLCHSGVPPPYSASPNTELCGPIRG